MESHVPSSKESGDGYSSNFPWSKNSLPKQLFIHNEYINSNNSKKLYLFNPKDVSPVANDVALGGQDDVDAAVAAAEAAFPRWKKTHPNVRRDIMFKFADLIEQHGKTLAELTRVTLGAP